ncbi:MAG: stage II sporulation protein D [Heliobacteriaceae bacterium]|nr:stage II sporulation protein D [Heliobacteriaceae bacterium]
MPWFWKYQAWLAGTGAFFIFLILGIPFLVLTGWSPITKLPAGPQAEPQVRLELAGETVAELAMEEYLVGVLAGEMSPLSPEEALKAQAVAARTFARHRQQAGQPLCPTVNSQVWRSPAERLERWGADATPRYTARLVAAVNATRGEVLVFEEQIVQAQYHASCGGRTEAAAAVWGGDRPYLQSVTCPEAQTPGAPAETRFRPADLDERFGTAIAALAPQVRPGAVQVVEKTATGRAQKVKIGREEIAGTRFRAALGLPSTDLTLAWQGPDLLVETRGRGHAVGMCQAGAKLLAEAGSTYDQILAHYYPGVTIRRDYP